MALDVQPLSPRRQAAMLLVLLALFGGSIGFAHLLVQWRQPGPAAPRFFNIVRAPQGFIEPVPAYEALEGAALTGAGQVHGKPRRFVVISYAADLPLDTAHMVDEGLRVLRQVGGDVDGQVPVSVSNLGGFPACALECEYQAGGDAAERAFVLERLAILPGEVVAICYSGVGAITDADRGFFKDFCDTGMVIRPIHAAVPSPGPAPR